MQARLIAFLPDQAAIVRTARPGETLRIGRAQDNDLRLDHPSVSRAHAQLIGSDSGWLLRDLGSKNGSYVDGRAVLGDVALAKPGWLRFGDIHCELGLLSALDLAEEDAHRLARRTAATAHTAQLERLTNLGDLLDASLRSVLDLSQCERGFVLLAQGDDFRVRSSQALDAGALPDRAFSGSVGAVRRALDERRAVVANDIASDAELAARHSIVSQGLRTLLCLPLFEGERTLGAIYADRTGPGPAITTLDVELLQAFAEHAAVWIAARRATEQLAQAGDAAPRWSRIVAAQAEVA
ncbi:FHA domain-containing protein [Lysobacter dokdonensis DS-58]|uniref:FHA domain-containing protein n=1 Tax=Lysobacter dokdonensis DS-58 TaxID=1300345 RepID=A0A0A2WFQ7_9GAMM|nr:GAF domain-containing protein [Lysobacter dokdonensis]KGQ18583.1 FHA domain-containing protein [Lysobacter dokdonensis DS-58]